MDCGLELKTNVRQAVPKAFLLQSSRTKSLAPTFSKMQEIITSTQQLTVSRLFLIVPVDFDIATLPRVSERLPNKHTCHT